MQKIFKKSEKICVVTIDITIKACYAIGVIRKITTKIIFQEAVS